MRLTTVVPLVQAACLEGVDAAHDLQYVRGTEATCDKTRRGLQNLGNTCYGNALIFALSKLQKVCRWAREHASGAQQNPLHIPANCPLCMLARDVANLGAADTIAPHIPEVMAKRRVWNVGFSGNAQQDVHEAFQYLMNSCDAVDASALQTLPPQRDMTKREFNASAIRHTTPYNQIFGNLQRARVTCTGCRYTYEDKYERSHALELALSDLGVDSLGRLIANHDSLGRLIANHFAKEALDADFCCESCGARGHGEKETKILHWPPVLAVSFKRFQYDQLTGDLRKIYGRIRYPLKYLPPHFDVEYHLRAVILHSGSFKEGHYTAYVRAHDDSWYLCDDGVCPRLVLNPSEIMEQEAYMLMYER
jgi:ubiquitin C-terminal hydrolase